MKNRIVIIAIVSFFAATGLTAQQIMQDVVSLKNGSIIRGTIIEQIPNISLKIQTKDGNVFVFKLVEIEKITKEPVEKPEQKRTDVGKIPGYKSPGLAVGLSCILPGGGQHYCGQHIMGAIQEVVFVGGIVLPFLFWNADDDLVMGMRIVGFAAAGASWIWSIIDAPITAGRINRRLAQNFGHLMQYGNDKYVIGFDFGSDENGIGAGFSIHF